MSTLELETMAECSCCGLASTDGKLFDVWIIDTVTHQYMRVDQSLCFADALDWQRKWFDAERNPICESTIPIIAPQEITMPVSMLQKSEDD